MKHEIVSREQIEKQNKLAQSRIDIIFVECRGEKYTILGTAKFRYSDVRFQIGWELKDLFNKAVSIDKFRFGVLKDVISRHPYYVFVIKPE